jgi:CHAT domain-containing protein
LSGLVLVLALMGGAQGAGAEATDAAQADAGAARLVEAAQLRLARANQPATLSAQGRDLLSQDVVTLDGYAYCGQATSLAEQGDFRQSIRAASKALYLGERDGKPDLQALAHRDLALAYLYAGKLDEAERYARSAQAFKGADPQQVMAPTHKVLGDVALQRGDATAAIAAYQAALAVASDRYRPQVQLSLANALMAAGQPKAALVQLDAIGVAAREAQGSYYLRARAKALLQDGQPEAALAVYDQIVQQDRTPDAEYQRVWALVGVARVHEKRQQPALALKSYLEATTLAGSLQGKFRSAEVRSGLFGDLQDVYGDALKLAVQQGDFATAWALSEGSRSRHLLDEVRGRTSDSLQGQLSLAQLQGLLGADEGVLEYLELGDSLVIWTIRHDSFKGQAVALPQATLSRQVEDFRPAIIHRRRDVNALGQALYEELVAPAALGNTKRLFVVPHGPLHYLPFQALFDGEQYLIARTALAVWPSASVGGQLWARPQRHINALLAFGNPATAENVPLPGAEREVKEVAQLFTDKQVYVQRDATKPRFKQTANDSAVLHVAAHAEVDDVDPLFSRILLASEGKERGLLEAREIYGIDMRGVSLVTLSACESGLGKIEKGDEIVGFTRSFLSAGASSLVASLWPVADDSTEALMTHMYQSMTDGADLMDAMRSAQLDVQQRRRFSHPFFWAPFNVVGNGRMKLGN